MQEAKYKVLRHIRAGIVALSCGVIVSTQAANIPPTPGDRELARQRQEQLLQDQASKLQELQTLPEQAEPVAPSPSDDSQCFPIQTIDLQGVTLLSDSEKNDLLSPWLNSCMGIGEINQLVKAITNLYTEKGYVTSRAYIPEQNLASGTLVILVVEGKISHFNPLPESDLSERELQFAFPASPGEFLNLRDLEQGIDQLNRLPSNTAQLKLQPGDKPGETVVGVANKPSRPWKASLGKHNNGSESTGDRQWQGSFSWDSPLGLGDQVTVGLGKDAVTDQYRQSRSGNLGYSLPWGYWTASYGFSYSDYETRNSSNGLPFSMTGNTRNHTLSLNRLLHRNQLGKTAVNTNIRHIRTRNFIQDNLIDISSQKLSEVSVGINHGRRLWKGFLNLDLGYQKGTTAFGAQKDHHPVDRQPKAQFSKYTATASYLLPFQLYSQNLTFSSMATGQWSHDVLYGPFRFSIGGLSSVRGFREQSLSGDSGGYWRNDLTWRTPVTAEPFSFLFQTFSAGVAYDAGVIHGGPYNPELYGRMTSRALAFALNGKHMDASVTLAESLSRPGVITNREHPVWFQLTLKI